MAVNLWSQTAASNASADPTVNWAEGQAPSSVNDSARAMMASVAKWRDDISGSIVTGGTATAYTLTTNTGFASLAAMDGQILTFRVNGVNGGVTTLNADGLGGKPLRTSSGAELTAGTLLSGGPYSAVYNNADACFYLHNFFGTPFNIPLGGLMDFIGATVPNSSFVFPIGQAISRTTYAGLFALTSTTYGAGDGSTTFNVPDLTGRVTAMKEASATRLTSTYFGGNSTVLGAVGGLESHTLTTAEMPSHSHANTLTDPGHTHLDHANDGGANNAGGASGGLSSTTSTGSSTTGITITNVSAGSGNAHAIVPPTIIVNKILRII